MRKASCREALTRRQSAHAQQKTHLIKRQHKFLAVLYRPDDVAGFDLFVHLAVNQRLFALQADFEVLSPGNLPIHLALETESEMRTPKNSDFDTLRAPNKHKCNFYILRMMGTSSA